MHSDRSPLLHRSQDRSQTHCQDCCLNYKSRRHHRSASSANAVTPTLSPHSALSFTLLAVVSLSVTALMSNSSASSLILMLNARHYCWNRHPTSPSLRCSCSQRFQSLMHSDRSPLLHRCTDRSQTHCQDCCLNYKSRRHHRSASSANAVTPTLSPHSALSFTLLAVVSLSVTALMSNSSASSLILMLNARHYCWNRHPTSPSLRCSCSQRFQSLMHSDRSPLLHRCTDRSQTHCQDCCLNYKSRRHHRSASSANAVTPTLSPHWHFRSHCWRWCHCPYRTDVELVGIITNTDVERSALLLEPSSDGRRHFDAHVRRGFKV